MLPPHAKLGGSVGLRGCFAVAQNLQKRGRRAFPLGKIELGETMVLLLCWKIIGWDLQLFNKLC